MFISPDLSIGGHLLHIPSNERNRMGLEPTIDLFLWGQMNIYEHQIVVSIGKHLSLNLHLSQCVFQFCGQALD